MKKEELKKLIDGALDNAKTLLLRDGYLMPVAFVWKKENVEIIGLTFKDKYEKEKQFFHLRRLVKDKKADAVFIIIESWYVTSDKKDMTIEPSKHPMRKECIMAFGECEEGDVVIMQQFDKKDGEIIFGEKDDIDASIFSKFDFGIKDRKKQNKDLKDLS